MCGIFCIPSWYPKQWFLKRMFGETLIFHHFSCNDSESSNWNNHFKVDVSTARLFLYLGWSKPHQLQVNWIDWLRSPNKVFWQCTRKDLFFWRDYKQFLDIGNILQLSQYWTGSNACLNVFKGVAHHGNKLLQCDVKLLRFSFWFGMVSAFKTFSHLVPKVVPLSKGHGQTCNKPGSGEFGFDYKKARLIGWYHFQASNLNSKKRYCWPKSG